MSNNSNDSLKQILWHIYLKIDTKLYFKTKNFVKDWMGLKLWIKYQQSLSIRHTFEILGIKYII